MVWQVAHAVEIPVIGMGGVDSAEKVAEMMMAGATAVQVGAANLVDPFACKKIIEALPGVLAKLGVERAGRTSPAWPVEGKTPCGRDPLRARPHFLKKVDKNFCLFFRPSGRLPPAGAIQISRFL